MAALFAACTSPIEGEGLLAEGLANPFPSRAHVGADGHLDIVADAMPRVGEGGLLDVAALSWRTGFSVSQNAVVRLDDVDAAALPSWRAPNPEGGSVRLVDLDTGTWLPVFAELDAYPDQPDPRLILRPQVAITPGHDVAYVVTTAAAPRPEAFDALLGKAPHDETIAEQTLDLLERLEGMGLPREEVAVAWEVPIDDGAAATRSAIGAIDPEDFTWSIDTLREGDDAAELAYRSAEGSFTVTGVLTDEVLAVDEVGGVTRTGTWEADLWVHVPESVADAPAGTVPVMVFGHGIFGRPQFYLDDNSGRVLELADEGGYIVVATSFRGLSRDDLLLATGVANDFNTLPRLTDRLVQSQVALRTLIEAIGEGSILDDPAFHGRSGQALAAVDDPVYYGISLGGIQGALAMGLGAPIQRGALHVPGAQWSSMLDRSSNFAVLEQVLLNDVPDPADRQLLYAFSQLHWDRCDPISVSSTLASTSPVLLQESLHDEQVPNMTTRALARSAGLPSVGPVTEAAWGLEVLDAPRGPEFSGWVQFDPQEDPPDEANRPADVTDAHSTPRQWATHREQTLTWLLDGTLVHPCGDVPCTPGNSER